MASTIDLRQGEVTAPAIPVEAINRDFVLSQVIDASDLSVYLSSLAAATHLVSGNTYKFLAIPAGTVVKRVQIIVHQIDSGAGTSTITNGTVVPLAAQIMTALGAFAGVTNCPLYFPIAGYLAGLIAAADLTDAIFEVIAECIRIPSAL